MELMGRMAASVIHDLNNILTVIQLNAGMLEIGGLDEAETAKFVEEINRACVCASALTRSVLNFSRRQDQPLSSFEVRQVLDGLLPLLGVLAKRTELVTDLPHGELWMEGSPIEFQQVILNLVTNAIDAAPKNGVRLSVRPGFSAGQNRETVEIEVQDSGNGIRPEDSPRIFDAFFTTKEPGSGTGLGLYIVKRIIDERGGTIDVRSIPGEGTTFRLSFPRLSARQEPGLASEAAPPPQMLSATVLLVEDDPGVRAIGRQILLRHGCRVFDAADSSEARACWDEHRNEIDLLFTDLILPGATSGDLLAREFLQQKPSLKVLYTSGKVDASQYAEHFSFANFLLKPYRPETLVESLSRLLHPASP